MTEAVDEAADSPDRGSSPSTASAPLAESEESDQSETTDKMGSDEDSKHHDDETEVPRLQLNRFLLFAGIASGVHKLPPPPKKKKKP